MDDVMQISKWGNSLAVRLPKAVVELLGLKEGDEVEITVAGNRDLKVERSQKIPEALKKMRALRRPLPPGFKFDRIEANER